MKAHNAAFTPAEVKRRLGLTTKALRLYGEKGLIKPARGASGWRVFTPADLSRLYQIKILRNFGLSLDQIAKLLNARGARNEAFAAVIRLQADSLRAEHERVVKALELLQHAQRLVDAGQKLEAEDLVRLAESAAQPPEMEIYARLRPHLARYFTERDYNAVTTASARNWQTLVDAAAALLARNPDPTSREARAMLDRWDALRTLYSGDDAELEARSAQMFNELMAHPDSSRHPIPAPVWAFMKAIKGAKE